MNDKRDFDRAVDRWLDDGTDATPPEVIDAVLLAAKSTAQEQDLRLFWRTSPMQRIAYAMAAVVVVAAGVTAFSGLGSRFGIGSGPSQSASPSVDLGIFEPVAGWIVYGNGGLWGIDPSTSAPSQKRVRLTDEPGAPLAWSSDGTRLLIRRGVTGGEYLVVLHADGAHTQVTERLKMIGGATFSADGARVVFAAESADEEWAVYSVDVEGGPATVLTSQDGQRAAHLQFSTISPDGTRIAFVLWGGGDHSHPVWVMDVDGTDAHEIVANDIVMGPGHLRDRGALAWSPAGDRIALALEGTIYTFATDGSDFKSVTGGLSPLWSPDGARVVGRSAATWHPGTRADGGGG